MSAAYVLRPASPADAGAIRRLIWETRLNPFELDYRRFVLAVDPHDRLAGCGQIKPHSDGSRELASIAVRAGHRRQGVASAIIRRLLEGELGPVYLTCRTALGPFYARFGFQAVAPDEMPAYFRRLHRLARLLRFFTSRGLLVMVRYPA